MSGAVPCPPVPFVVGAGRSGTTLLRLMLDSHPGLAIPAETHFIPRLAQRFATRPVTGASFSDALAAERRWGDFGIDAGELSRRLGPTRELELGEALRGFYRAYAERQGKDRWGDKTPGYCQCMTLVRELLPEARFIHLIRDGRDVALASSERNGRDPAENAAVWRRKVAAARSQRRRLTGYHEVRFEDLVGAPEATLRELCGVLELDWEPEMLNYHRRAPERLRELGDLRGRRIGGQSATAELRRSFYELNTKPLRDAEIGRGRRELAPPDLAAVEREAGDLLTELGYGLGR